MTQLLRSLRYIGTPEGSASIEGFVKDKLNAELPFALEWHKANNVPISDSSSDFDSADVEAFTENWEKQSKAAIRLVKKTISKALTNLEECKGLKKLNECCDALKISERFTLRTHPIKLPIEEQGMFDALGVIGKKRRTFGMSAALRPAWEAHVASWDINIHGQFTSLDTLKYWKLLATEIESRELGELALHHLLRPVAAAACERVFSYLTAMDAPCRRSMGRVLLINLLKLRGNAEIVLELTAEAAHSKRQAVIAAQSASAKRNHDAHVSGATAAVQSASKKARPAIEVQLADEGRDFPSSGEN